MMLKVAHRWFPRILVNIKSMVPQCSATGCQDKASLLQFFKRREGITFQNMWFCSPECFEHAVSGEVQRLFGSAEMARRSARRMPLGLLLLSHGTIDKSQLRAALEAQRAGGGRIGQLLLKMGAIDEHQIAKAIGEQWACPSLKAASVQWRSISRIPSRLLELHRMLPVHYVGPANTLYMAFSDGVDHSAMYAIGQMLDCRVEPCIIRTSFLEHEIEQARRVEPSSDVIFEAHCNPSEIARITRSYALQLHASAARLVRCGEYAWGRLKGCNSSIDLLFRIVQSPLNGSMAAANN